MSTSTCMPKQIPKKGILLRRANSIAFTCSPEIKPNNCIYHPTSWFISQSQRPCRWYHGCRTRPGPECHPPTPTTAHTRMHTHTHTHTPRMFSHRCTRVLRWKENNRLAQVAYLDRTRVGLQLFCIDPVDGAWHAGMLESHHCGAQNTIPHITATLTK